jgi:hypothetical protein
VLGENARDCMRFSVYLRILFYGGGFLKVPVLVDMGDSAVTDYVTRSRAEA